MRPPFTVAKLTHIAWFTSWGWFGAYNYSSHGLTGVCGGYHDSWWVINFQTSLGGLETSVRTWCSGDFWWSASWQLLTGMILQVRDRGVFVDGNGKALKSPSEIPPTWCFTTSCLFKEVSLRGSLEGVHFQCKLYIPLKLKHGLIQQTDKSCLDVWNDTASCGFVQMEDPPLCPWPCSQEHEVLSMMAVGCYVSCQTKPWYITRLYT